MAKYCANCGTSLPEGAQFCPSCGQGVFAAPHRPEHGAATPRPGGGSGLLIGLGVLVAGLAVVLVAIFAYPLLTSGDSTGEAGPTAQEPEPATTEFTVASTLTEHSELVHSVAFSPDGETVASGSYDDTIMLWDPTTGELQNTLTGHSSDVESVTFSPDGETVASGDDDGTIMGWDAATGEQNGTIDAHTDWVHSVAFSPDGDLLASGSKDSTIKVWDTGSGEELHSLPGLAYSVAFSPDGDLLASAEEGEGVWLWDPQTGEGLGSLVGHSGPVRSVAFSPDGETVASGGEDGTARLWDAQSEELLHTLALHSDPVTSVVFSPDGRLLASASDNGTIRLWDARSGDPLEVFSGQDSGVYSIAFSPDGNLLASGGGDGTVDIWERAEDAVDQTGEANAQSSSTEPQGDGDLAEGISITSTDGWQQTPLTLQQGDEFEIRYGEGEWSVDYRNFEYVGPEGYSAEVDEEIYQSCKVDDSLPYATLLGQVGDGEVFAVGEGGVFTADASDALSLGINDVCLEDNDGELIIVPTATDAPPPEEAEIEAQQEDGSSDSEDTMTMTSEAPALEVHDG